MRCSGVCSIAPPENVSKATCALPLLSNVHLHLRGKQQFNRALYHHMFVGKLSQITVSQGVHTVFGF